MPLGLGLLDCRTKQSFEYVNLDSEEFFFFFFSIIVWLLLVQVINV